MSASSPPPPPSSHTTITVITTTLASGATQPPAVSGLSGTRSGNVLVTSVYTVVPISSSPPSSSVRSLGSSTDSFSVTSTTLPTPTSHKGAGIHLPNPSLPLDIPFNGVWGVLGVVLMITGFPLCFLGARNRWSSLFFVGFYTLSIVTICLIFKWGVLPMIALAKPPPMHLQVVFLVVSIIAGFIGGAVCVLTPSWSRHLVPAYGGFLFALWIQSLHQDGLIHRIGIRIGVYMSSIGSGLVASLFVSSVSRDGHEYSGLKVAFMMLGTAWTGAFAFILGVDCFTRQGLKEYETFNLGFGDLFSAQLGRGKFPVTQRMQAELAVTCATAILGVLSQSLLLHMVNKRRRLRGRSPEARSVRESLRKGRERSTMLNVQREKDRQLWEARHGRGKARESGEEEHDPEWTTARGDAETMVGEGRKAVLNDKETTPKLTAVKSTDEQTHRRTGPFKGPRTSNLSLSMCSHGVAGENARKLTPVSELHLPAASSLTLGKGEAAPENLAKGDGNENGPRSATGGGNLTRSEETAEKEVAEELKVNNVGERNTQGHDHRNAPSKSRPAEEATGRRFSRINLPSTHRPAGGPSLAMEPIAPLSFDSFGGKETISSFRLVAEAGVGALNAAKKSSCAEEAGEDVPSTRKESGSHQAKSEHLTFAGDSPLKYHRKQGSSVFDIVASGGGRALLEKKRESVASFLQPKSPKASKKGSTDSEGSVVALKKREALHSRRKSSTSLLPRDAAATSARLAAAVQGQAIEDGSGRNDEGVKLVESPTKKGVAMSKVELARRHSRQLSSLQSSATKAVEKEEAKREEAKMLTTEMTRWRARVRREAEEMRFFESKREELVEKAKKKKRDDLMAQTDAQRASATPQVAHADPKGKAKEARPEGTGGMNLFRPFRKLASG